MKFLRIFWSFQHRDSGSQLVSLDWQLWIQTDSSCHPPRRTKLQTFSSTIQAHRGWVLDVGVAFFQAETSALLALLTAACLFLLLFQILTSSLCHVSSSSTWWTGPAGVWRPSVCGSVKHKWDVLPTCSVFLPCSVDKLRSTGELTSWLKSLDRNPR